MKLPPATSLKGRHQPQAHAVFGKAGVQHAGPSNLYQLMASLCRGRFAVRDAVQRTGALL